MQRDAEVYLWHIHEAASLICKFVEGRTWEEYSDDELLRSAVERQFTILGEALNQLSRTAPDIAAKIAETPRIISFRNIIVHGYAIVDNRLVWQLATTRTSEVLNQATELLNP